MVDRSPQDIIIELKTALFNRGAVGLRGLARNFRIADDNGNKKLDREEFEEVLNYSGLFPTSANMTKLFNHFDISGDGNISLDEFYTALQGDLNPRRLDIVMKAFAKIDKDGSGELTVDDIADIYDVSQHPHVVEAKRSEEEVLKDFLDGFDGAAGNNDGKVTIEEFKAYYRDVGGSIPSDDYFVMMVESSWGVKESDNYVEEEWGQIKNILVEKCRQKCGEGANEMNKAKAVLKHFDEDESGYVSKQEFAKAVERLGLATLSGSTIDIVFARNDTNRDGKLSIDEFVASIFA